MRASRHSTARLIMTGAHQITPEAPIIPRRLYHLVGRDNVSRMTVNPREPVVTHIELPTSWGPQRVSFFDRAGPRDPIVFVHGLGNAASNFEDLPHEPALDAHRLIALDFPGCGQSPYPAGHRLEISHVAELLSTFVDTLELPRFLLVGASMGGLTSLLYAEQHPERLLAFVNVEGNLAPEDCMYSRVVAAHDYETFSTVVFPGIKTGLAAKSGRGFAKHLQVLERADPLAYFDYSFQLVRDSDSGTLLDRFLGLPMLRHFVYGSANRSLSYLPRLRASDCVLTEIPDADHFLFYDNPKAFAECLAETLRMIHQEPEHHR
jgi:pimeloyl-ACP methyl ester carboxylesterase